MISDSDESVYIKKRTRPQVITLTVISYGFSIIKTHFISNFCAYACDPIHFQDMQRALGPLPYVLLICQN